MDEDEFQTELLKVLDRIADSLDALVELEVEKKNNDQTN
jgi:hypothetical protein